MAFKNDIKYYHKKKEAIRQYLNQMMNKLTHSSYTPKIKATDQKTKQNQTSIIFNDESPSRAYKHMAKESWLFLSIKQQKNNKSKFQIN